MKSHYFHIITFGCQMNEHDSERMAGLLEGEGYTETPDVQDAGLIILNTCSIRQKAEQKFFSEVGRLRDLKELNPDLKIAVAGCIAQQEGAKIFSRAPHVDLVFGPSDIAKLPSILDRADVRRSSVVETGGDPEYHLKNIFTKRADRVKAWVSIMYGCDNFCTYCVVPFLRGRERSRPAEDIVREVRNLAREGCREVTLLGQNVNSYGKGIDERIDFPDLLRIVANEETSIERIRFVTSHPKDLSDKLITSIRDLPKVCEAIHLPLQSGSDRILASMNRKYGAADYLDKIQRLRQAVPGISITTDIIAGFPGETEEDFGKTMDILRTVGFEGVFAFKYSQRPNTAALKMEGHVPENVKERRLSEVLELQQDITIERNKRYIGTVQEVLADGHSKKGGKLTGRTRSNKAVNFNGPASLIGTLIDVHITSAGMNSLSGEVCG